MNQEYNYNVEIRDLMLADGTKTDFKATVRADTNEPLGVVSSRYSVIQNNDLVNSVEDAFRDLGLKDYSRQIFVEKGGARMFARYDFKEITYRLKNVGDEVGFRMTLQNSHDKSLTSNFELGILRLVCKNGMVRPNSEFKISKIHMGIIDLSDIEASVINAAKAFPKLIEVFDKMSTVDISQDQGHLILQNMVGQRLLSDRLKVQIANVWDKPTYKEDRGRNLFNLYNASTEVLSHQVEEKSYQLSNKVNHRIASTLIEASNDKTRFEELLKLAS